MSGTCEHEFATLTPVASEHEFAPGGELRALDALMRWALARGGNRQRAGLDGVPPATIASGEALRCHARRLAAKFRAGSWYWVLCRRARFLRGEKVRWHGLATADDTGMLRAITRRLWGTWGRMPRGIVGGRPGTTSASAVRFVHEGIAATKPAWVLRTDLADAYATCSPDLALSCLECLAGDDRQREVRMLREFYERQRRGGWQGLIEGTPQSALLLATVVAMHFAPVFARSPHGWVAWADDAISFWDTKKDALKALHELHVVTGVLGMKLNRAKTFVTRVESSAWSFLGYSFAHGGLTPDESRLAALEDRIERKAYRCRKPGRALGILEGWAEHFFAPITHDLVDRAALARADENLALLAALYRQPELPSLLTLFDKFAARQRGPGAKHRPPTRAEESRTWEDWDEWSPA